MDQQQPAAPPIQTKDDESAIGTGGVAGVAGVNGVNGGGQPDAASQGALTKDPFSSSPSSPSSSPSSFDGDPTTTTAAATADNCDDDGADHDTTPGSVHDSFHQALRPPRAVSRAASGPWSSLFRPVASATATAPPASTPDAAPGPTATNGANPPSHQQRQQQPLSSPASIPSPSSAQPSSLPVLHPAILRRLNTLITDMSARCQDAIILLNETLQAPSAPDDPLVDAESIQDALALCLQTVSNSIIIAFAAAEALMGRESSGSVHRMEVASRLERARTACATLKPQADQLARMATGPSPVIRAVEAQREEVLHNVSVVDAELGLLWARLLGRMEEIQASVGQSPRSPKAADVLRTPKLLQELIAKATAAVAKSDSTVDYITISSDALLLGERFFNALRKLRENAYSASTQLSMEAAKDDVAELGVESARVATGNVIETTESAFSRELFQKRHPALVQSWLSSLRAVKAVVDEKSSSIGAANRSLPHAVAAPASAFAASAAGGAAARADAYQMPVAENEAEAKDRARTDTPPAPVTPVEAPAPISTGPPQVDSSANSNRTQVITAAWTAAMERLSLISDSSTGEPPSPTGTTSTWAFPANEPPLPTSPDDAASVPELVSHRKSISQDTVQVVKSLDALVRVLAESALKRSADGGAPIAVSTRGQRSVADTSAEVELLCGDVRDLLLGIQATSDAVAVSLTPLPGLGYSARNGAHYPEGSTSGATETLLKELRSRTHHVQAELDKLGESLKVLESNAESLFGSSAKGEETSDHSPSNSAAVKIGQTAVMACVDVAERAASLNGVTTSLIRLAGVLFGASGVAFVKSSVNNRKKSVNGISAEYSKGETLSATHLRSTSSSSSSSVFSELNADTPDISKYITDPLPHCIEATQDLLYVKRLHREELSSDGLIVKYASLRELIGRATHHEVHDPTLVTCLLQTLPTFASPLKVLRYLTTRIASTLTYPPSLPQDLQVVYFHRIHLPVRVSCLELLNAWVELYPADFHEPGCPEEIYKIMKMPLVPAQSPVGEDVALEAYATHLISLIRAVDSAMFRALKRKETTVEEILSQFRPHLKVVYLAHLTSVDRALYVRISYRDIINGPFALGYTDPRYPDPIARQKSIAPFLVGLIDRADAVARMVRNSVYDAGVDGWMQAKAGAAAHLIQVANHLLFLRNIQSAHTITDTLSSLYTPQLFRMWQLVPPQLLAELDAIRSLFSPAAGYQRLRAFMDTIESRTAPLTVPLMKLQVADAWSVMSNSSAYIRLSEDGRPAQTSNSGPFPLGGPGASPSGSLASHNREGQQQQQISAVNPELVSGAMFLPASPSSTSSSPSPSMSQSSPANGNQQRPDMLFPPPPMLPPQATPSPPPKIRWTRCRTLGAIAEAALRFQTPIPTTTTTQGPTAKRGGGGGGSDPWPLFPSVFQAIDFAAAAPVRAPAPLPGPDLAPSASAAAAATAATGPAAARQQRPVLTKLPSSAALVAPASHFAAAAPSATAAVFAGADLVATAPPVPIPPPPALVGPVPGAGGPPPLPKPMAAGAAAAMKGRDWRAAAVGASGEATTNPWRF